MTGVCRPYVIDLSWAREPSLDPFALPGYRGQLWRLHEPMPFVVTLGGEQRAYEVPAGFVTDGASIPWAFRWLIPQHQTTWAPALWHDYVYGSRGWGELTRQDADDLFGVGLTKQRIPARRVAAMYLVVKRFGGKSWRDDSLMDAHNRAHGLLATA